MKKLALGGVVALCLTGSASAMSHSFETDPLDFHDLPASFDVFDPATLESHHIWSAAKTGLGLLNPKTKGKLDYSDFLASRSGDYGGENKSVVNTGVSNIELIYLGSEAGFQNTAKIGETTLFNNKSSVFGDTVTLPWTGGRLDFRFCTDRGTTDLADDGCISNDPEKNTGMATELELAVSRVFKFDGRDTVLFFFGDGVAHNDADLDDMVVAARIVSSVPLPAGLLLLGTALAGLGALGSAKRRQS